MDEAHLLAAVRYVARGPLKAGPSVAADDWPWSSTGAHIARLSTLYVTVEPVLARIVRIPTMPPPYSEMMPPGIPI